MRMRLTWMIGILTLLAVGCASGEPSPQPPNADIVFDMKEEYRLGEPVEIAVRNHSDLDYYYQFQYPACYNLQFFDDSQESRPYPNAEPVLKQRYLSPGRFIVPRGTHCDTIWEKSIDPGRSVVVFTWDQQMCIKDRFGCIESVPVQPGEYLIQGEFSSAARVIGPGWDRKPDMITTISWSLTIQPP